MMTIFEAAQYLRMSPFSLRKMARSGKIPAGKVGKQWRFRQEDLDRFLTKQYEEQANAA